MHTPASSEGQGPAQPGPLPNGLHVREDAADGEHKPAEVQGGPADTRRWSITGRNPQFWWDIVLTGFGGDADGFDLHCTRCSIRDQAYSMEDLLRLIRAQAHFHGTDPVGEP